MDAASASASASAPAKGARDCSAMRTVQSRRNCLRQQGAGAAAAPHAALPPPPPPPLAATEQTKQLAKLLQSAIAPQASVSEAFVASAEGGRMWSSLGRVAGAVLLLAGLVQLVRRRRAARATYRYSSPGELSEASRMALSAQRRAVY